jgi:transporter family protein
MAAIIKSFITVNSHLFKLFKLKGGIYMWQLFAILSALFAALTSILAKIGINGVDSNLATAIRTVVILALAWGIVLVFGGLSGIKNLNKQNWTFLILSGLATGLSWLFYYKAISLGKVSQVAPIDKSSIVLTLLMSFFILGEQFTMKTLIAGILITAGTFIMIF